MLRMVNIFFLVGVFLDGDSLALFRSSWYSCFKVSIRLMGQSIIDGREVFIPESTYFHLGLAFSNLLLFRCCFERFLVYLSPHGLLRVFVIIFFILFIHLAFLFSVPIFCYFYAFNILSTHALKLSQSNFRKSLLNLHFCMISHLIHLKPSINWF